MLKGYDLMPKDQGINQKIFKCLDYCLFEEMATFVLVSKI